MKEERCQALRNNKLCDWICPEFPGYPRIKLSYFNLPWETHWEDHIPVYFVVVYGKKITGNIITASYTIEEVLEMTENQNAYIFKGNVYILDIKHFTQLKNRKLRPNHITFTTKR